MATQLGVINEALDMLGETNLAASELANRSGKSARVMADGWPAAVDECLSSAPWRFASRLASLTAFGADEADPSIYAAPGYYRAFQIPDDHLRTNWLRDTPYEQTRPIPFHIEGPFWHTGTTTLTVSYVSHQFRPPETWTPLFATTVAAYLAWKKGQAIRPAANEQEARIRFYAMLDQARTVDASETPFSEHPTGRLVRSRGGGYGRIGVYPGYGR